MGASETRRASVGTAALHGVETVPVTVEIEVGPGLPGMHIVGMADTAVQEARQRVRSALRAAGFAMPSDRHIVVNLSPASVRKTGSGFDLPIAAAYLLATRQVDDRVVSGKLVVGELTLNGAVRPAEGLFAYALAARERGMSLLSGPVGTQLPHLAGLVHECAPSLGCLRTGRFDPPLAPRAAAPAPPPDFADVVGQPTAVRALTIAAAGAHGILMVGPPGAGKSMLAKRLPSILPPLDAAERVETALVHSVAGLDLSQVTAGIRPFRSPHHSATAVSLVGGGSRVLRPGEASLAHNGVLFLDELGEFGSSVLQALRQPMEEGRVVLCRAEGRAVFPASFQLVAASNPCPCGYLGDPDHVCRCSEAQVNRYQSKLGGPLKDRIDLICEVTRVDPARVLESGSGASSALLADRVLAARERADARGDARRGIAATTPRDAIEACGLPASRRRLVEDMARKSRLSGRGIVRVLRVARTIADLEDSADVLDDHLYESFMFRTENTLE